MELATAPPGPTEVGATLPPRPSPCVISGDGEPHFDPGEPDRPFDVFDATTGKRPIAKVRFPTAVAASWSGFVKGQKLARVKLDSGGLELSGWAEYGARRFSLLNAVELIGPHVVALEGSLVHITAFSGRLASIAIETPFNEPRALEMTIDCSQLVYAYVDTPPASEGEEKPQFVELIGERLVLYDAPGGNSLLEVRGPASPPDYPTLIATRDGYARIKDLWGTLLIDAWLPETQVKRAASIQAGPGGRAPAVGHSNRIAIRVATVLRKTSISVGQRPGGAVGSLEQATVVRVLTAQGGAVGVRLEDIYVEPPEGQYFWIERSALSAPRDAVVDE